jgi:pimeloyl-ACP methyl ester carboxylesterase
MSERAAIVLVHGAWMGSWCWDDVRARLRNAEIVATAVDNPSVTVPGSDLRADVDNVLAALDATPGPVVLVGHSYGGAVVSDAAAHPNVVHTVFITAFPLEVGESVASNALTGGEASKLAEALVFDGDTISVDRAQAVPAFFHDCADADAQAARDRLRPMSAAAMAGTVNTAGWRQKPSTYVICTEDHVLPTALQRSAASRVERVIDIPSSHSPFLSRPDDVARIIVGVAAG